MNRGSSIGLLKNLKFEKEKSSVICLSRLKEGRYTTINPRILRTFWSEEYHFGSELLFSTHTSFVVPKKSPLSKVSKFEDQCIVTNFKCNIFQGILGRCLGWLRDAGVIQKMIEDSVRGSKVSPADNIARARPLTIQRLFLIEIIGEEVRNQP